MQFLDERLDTCDLKLHLLVMYVLSVVTPSVKSMRLSKFCKGTFSPQCASSDRMASPEMKTAGFFFWGGG
jgi:hypothetical protein